jgi:hypothetical protein
MMAGAEVLGKIGHEGNANKAVPGGWIRRILDTHFATE